MVKLLLPVDFKCNGQSNWEMQYRVLQETAAEAESVNQLNAEWQTAILGSLLAYPARTELQCAVARVYHRRGWATTREDLLEEEAITKFVERREQVASEQ